MRIDSIFRISDHFATEKMRTGARIPYCDRKKNDSPTLLKVTACERYDLLPCSIFVSLLTWLMPFFSKYGRL